MSFSNALYLATRSLLWFRGRAITIVCCLALTLWLPVTVRLLLNQFRAEIVKRADATPLIIGSRGSQIDLALHALYFESVSPETTTMSEAAYVQDSGFATPIPLHIAYQTQSTNNVDGVPIVGTTFEYFEFRQLSLSSGEGLAILGDCVLGSNVARKTNLKPGDHILSAPKNAFNLAGDYPLRMNIVGVLNPAHSPDDDAVFVDIKTAWIIDGIGHGHQDLTASDVDQDILLHKSDKSVTASAAVLPYTQITEKNVDSFHFHGDESTFPVSAIIAVPNSRKEQTLLLGRYASDRSEAAQCVKPSKVVSDLLSIVFRVEQLIWMSSLLSAIVTALLLGLVLLLSIRLREAEMRTMHKLGCSRFTIVTLVGTEIAILSLIGLALALTLAWLTQIVAADWLRSLVF